MEQKDQKNLLIAGVIVIAIGAGYAIYQAQQDDDTTVGCALTAAGVGTLATALSRGSTADEVIRIAGPVATAAGCKALVEALIDGDSGQLEIETPSGTTEQEVTLPELTAPPPTEAPPNVLDCLKYDIQFLFDLCVDGTIAPPAA